MRLLYCNKYNYRFSGTEVYLFELMELMRSKGHEVALFSMADDRGAPTPYDKYFVPHVDFKGQLNWGQKVHGAAHAIYSTEARRRIRSMIQEFRPGIHTGDLPSSFTFDPVGVASAERPCHIPPQ